MGMNILVTGASGFLGSKLALELLSLGHKVSLVLRSASRLDRLGEHASEFAISRATNKGDIQDFVSHVIPDIVVHTACSYGRHGESPLEISDANYRFGLMIAQAALATNRAVTFINTGTVLDPRISLYALTKHQFSQTGHALAVAQNSEFRFVNVLLEHMYGPGDDAAKFTARVFHACRCNLPQLDLTAGTQKRDFIYIDDVVSAYTTIIDAAKDFDQSASIQIGSGEAVSVRNFVKTVHRLSESTTRLNFGALPFRRLEPMHCRADISQLKSLGWEPKVKLETGIRRTLESDKHFHVVGKFFADCGQSTEKAE